jgi:predicted DNA-binding protein
MGRKPILGARAAKLKAMRLPEEILVRIADYAAKRGLEEANAIRELLERGLRSYDRAQKRKRD